MGWSEYGQAMSAWSENGRMKMRTVTIHETPCFTITSCGGGFAYLFANKITNRHVFFQGDDADAFRTEMETIDASSMALGASYDDLFGAVWADYADVLPELIGVAVEGTKAGVILASFNAG